MKLDLKELFEKENELLESTVVLNGWVRNHRKQKEFGFIDFYDGTCFKTLQIVYTNKLSDFENISKMRIGSSIEVKGKLIKSIGSGQSVEIEAEEITLLGDAPEDYPMQPKRHTREFLRSLAYLRPRVNLYSSICNT